MYGGRAGRPEIVRAASWGQGLLTYLATATGCMLLSELQAPWQLPRLKLALETAKSFGYSMEEWNDAVRYMTGREAIFEEVKYAAGYLERVATSGHFWRRHRAAECG